MRAASDFRAALVRLNADGSLDSEFGALGKKTLDFGLATPDSQIALGVALQGEQITASGVVGVSGGGTDNFVVRLKNDLIFADGLE